MRFTCQALLFDLDGTLIDSLPAVERAWKTFAARHCLDKDKIMSQIHGRRSIDSIRLLLPSSDHLQEDAFIRQLESTDTEGVIPLPGVIEFLRGIPKDRWAIVTSGTSDVARARCGAAGIPQAGAYVFGEDVVNGKPDPEPFLLASKRLGFEPSGCIGFEDTEAGVRSILSAGMTAVAIRLPFPNSIPDFTSLTLAVDGQDLHLSFPTRI